jgi:hypothetical protein
VSDTYCVIGIDPGLANVGLVLLVSPSPSKYQVDAHVVVQTGSEHKLVDRLRHIDSEVRRFISGAPPADAVVVELSVQLPDRARRGRSTVTKRRPRDIAVLQVANGVALAAALAHPTRPVVALLDVGYWMPKAQSGNFTHTQRREHTMAQLRQLVAFPPLLKTHEEHVIMAAGVARRWVEDERLRRKRERQGIRL